MRQISKTELSPDNGCIVDTKWKVGPLSYHACAAKTDAHAQALDGNMRSEKGRCVWSGLFMTGVPEGVNMGWAATSFISVDEKKVATSEQYCLARGHGPLHRPSKQQ